MKICSIVIHGLLRTKGGVFFFYYLVLEPKFDVHIVGIPPQRDLNFMSNPLGANSSFSLVIVSTKPCLSRGNN